MKFALVQLADQSVRHSRFSEEQIIGILKEHGEAEEPSIQWIDGSPNDVAVSDPCCTGVGDASIDTWKAEFGDMDVSEAERLRALKGANTEPKRMLADAVFDNVGPKDPPGRKWRRPPRSGMSSPISWRGGGRASGGR